MMGPKILKVQFFLLLGHAKLYLKFGGDLTSESLDTELYRLRGLVGRPGGLPVPDDDISIVWLHLASWNLLDSQLS